MDEHGTKSRQRRVQNEIRQIRCEMGLTQVAFAKLMNICRETAQAWEYGFRNPLKGELLSIWWRGPIKASVVAGRIIQVAFQDAEG